MVFSQEFIDKLKDSVDMVNLANQFTEMKYIGGDLYRGRCPHPDHTDSEPSLTIWTKTNTWSCYGCHSGKKGKDNYGSDCIAFLRYYKNLSFVEAVLELCKMEGIQPPVDKDEHSHLYKQNLDLAYKYNKNISQRAKEYLYSRGLDDSDIKEFLLGSDNEDRIVFPLIDKQKRVVGFTRRWIKMPKGKTDKYNNSKNSSIFNKGNFLYGFDNIDTKTEKYIRITEGSMDVILARKYGVKNIVAPLGTGFTENHVKMIKSTGLIPVLILDGDKAGLKAMDRIASLFLKEGMYCKVKILPENQDLAELSLKWKDYTKDAVLDTMPYGYYKAKKAVDIYYSKLYELKAEMMPQLKEIISEVPTEEKNLVSAFLEKEMNIVI